MLEVRIDKKIHSWSGSIEMGITQCDPHMLDAPFPSSATELREGTWIMSGEQCFYTLPSIKHTCKTTLGTGTGIESILKYTRKCSSFNLPTPYEPY